MYIQRFTDGRRRRNFKLIYNVISPTRWRHLCSHHVPQARTIRASGRLRHCREPRRARGCQFVADSGRLTATPHRCVEMQLVKSRSRIRGNHRLGLAHRHFGGLVPPGIRSQMVSTQYNACCVETFLPRNTHHQSGKVCRSHSRITAVMIDLVASRFDERDRSRPRGMPQRGPQNDRIGRADRRNTLRVTRNTRCAKRIENRAVHAGTFERMRVSSSARVPTPSIGPRTVTFRAPAAQA